MRHQQPFQITRDKSPDQRGEIESSILRRRTSQARRGLQEDGGETLVDTKQPSEVQECRSRRFGGSAFAHQRPTLSYATAPPEIGDQCGFASVSAFSLLSSLASKPHGLITAKPKGSCALRALIAASPAIYCSDSSELLQGSSKRRSRTSMLIGRVGRSAVLLGDSRGTGW